MYLSIFDSMHFSIIQSMKQTHDLKEDKVVLSKGIRLPSGHQFEFFATDSGIFLIVRNSIDNRSQMFKIDMAKVPVLERAVDEHID